MNTHLRITHPPVRETLLLIFNGGPRGVPRDIPELAWLTHLAELADCGLTEAFTDARRIGREHRVRLTELGIRVVATLLLPKEEK